MGRYANRREILIDGDMYRRVLSEKERKRITVHATPTFPEKTADFLQQLRPDRYVWRMSDNYYKVAHKVYGDRDLWWVIAWYNEAPSEAYIRRGDVIMIPRPVETVVSHFYSR